MKDEKDMNKILKTLACFTFILAAFAFFQTHACASPAITLNPVSGSISGFAGRTIGWGFTLTNDSDKYLVVSSADFQPSQNSVGTFTDFLGPQGRTLAPGESLTQAFDTNLQQGIGSLALNPNIAAESNVTGRILLTYDLYTAGGDQVGFSELLAADASVTGNPPTVPSIDTPIVNSVTATSATLGTTIESDNGASVTAAGAAYGPNANPDITGSKIVAGVTSGSFTVNATGLTPNTLYNFRGYATNSVGTGYTANTTFTTIAEAPTATAATAVTPSGFTANWTAPSGTAAISGYRLDVATNSGFTSMVAGYNDLSVSGTSTAVTGLSPNATYFYRVRAVNPGGMSSNSNTITVTSLVNPPVANYATGITATGFTANWTAPSGTAIITGYRLDVATNSGFTSMVAGYNDLSVSGTSKAITGLTAGGTYFYRVRAVNAGGTGANSNTITTTLPAASAMTLLSPNGGESWKAGSKQTIRWTLHWCSQY